MGSVIKSCGQTSPRPPPFFFPLLPKPHISPSITLEFPKTQSLAYFNNNSYTNTLWHPTQMHRQSQMQMHRFFTVCFVPNSVRTYTILCFQHGCMLTLLWLISRSSIRLLRPNHRTQRPGNFCPLLRQYARLDASERFRCKTIFCTARSRSCCQFLIILPGERRLSPQEWKNSILKREREMEGRRWVRAW